MPGIPQRLCRIRYVSPRSPNPAENGYRHHAISSHDTRLIAGGGPAGIALLLAASRMGELPRLLDEGLTLVEQGSHIGSGMLGRYVINSDSAAETFVDALTDNPVPELARLCTHPLIERIRSHGRCTLPLRVVAEYLDLVGHVLASLIRKHPASRLLTGWRLTSLRQGERGEWAAYLVSADGAHTQHVTARRVVLALGANQPEQRLYNEPVGDHTLLPKYHDRLMQSDDLLSPTGISRLRSMVMSVKTPRIAIVGGASSALSVARVILRDMADLLMPGHLTMVHKSRLKLFYRTAEEAVPMDIRILARPISVQSASSFTALVAYAMIHAIWPCA